VREACPDDNGAPGDAGKAIVAALAGPEAEARHLAASSRRPLAEVRAEIRQKRLNHDGDFANVATWLPDASISRAEADQQAMSLVTHRWESIRRVAELLMFEETLTGADLYHSIRGE
jgi:hypothetical protein